MRTKIFYILIGMAAFGFCRAQKRVSPSLSYADRVLTVDGIRDTLFIWKDGKLIFRQMIRDPPLDIWIRTGQGHYIARIDTLRQPFTVD